MSDYDNDILCKECRVSNDGITYRPIVDYYGDIREVCFDIIDYNCGAKPIIKIKIYFKI